MLNVKLNHIKKVTRFATVERVVKRVKIGALD